MKLDLFALFLLAVISSSSVLACTPEYRCQDWSSCNNGIESRTCSDISCGTGDIVERRLCTGDNQLCNTNYQCSDWSQCTYLSKTEDVLTGNLQFSGYQERACADLNSCVDDFVEERKCADSFAVRFVTVERCGEPFVVALDTRSDREVSKIAVDAWRQQKLDITFVQSNFSYCASCYNGIQDSDETDIDCGGSCKECVEESGISEQVLIVSSSWAVSGVFFILLVFFCVFDKKSCMARLLYKTHRALESGNKSKAEEHYNQLKKRFSKIKPEHKELFDKDLKRLSRKF